MEWLVNANSYLWEGIKFIGLIILAIIMVFTFIGFFASVLEKENK